MEIADNVGGERQYEELTCTGGHPFWVSQGEALAERPTCTELPSHESAMTPSGRWTEARWLRIGDHFLTKTGKSATVVGLTIRMERVQVYNLQVKNLQLYAVGEHGVLVHNKNTTIRATPQEATRIVNNFRGNSNVRFIYDRKTGRIVGEITDDGRVIRYPHTDRGTPEYHWNLENGNDNCHVIVDPW